MSSAPRLIAFSHISKTAGMTLHHILRRTYGTSYVVVEKRYWTRDPMDSGDLRRLRWRYWNLRAFGGHPVLPRNELVEDHPEIRFVTMLRDPVARCASEFAHFVRLTNTEQPFLSWLADERRHNHQTVVLAGAADAEAAIRLLEERFMFVGLVEHYDESLRTLGRFIPELAVPAEIPRRNPSRRRSVRDEVLADADAVAAIRETHREDFRLYRHVQAVIWPRQRDAAPLRPAAGPSEFRAAVRATLSRAKERALLGVPRRLAGAGIRLGKPL